MTVTVKFALDPLQILVVPAKTAVDGRAFTVTSGVPLGVVAVHPFASVTDVKVYVVFVIGDTEMLLADV